MQHAALVFLVMALQHGLQSRFHVFQGNIRDKAKPALVDANQRNTMRSELPAKTQHGAVASDHQGKVALLGNACNIHHRATLITQIRCGVFFHHHVAALAEQKSHQGGQYGLTR